MFFSVYSESIFGYQNLEVNLFYTAGKLNTYLGMKYTKQVDPKQFEGAIVSICGVVTNV